MDDPSGQDHQNVVLLDYATPVRQPSVALTAILLVLGIPMAAYACFMLVAGSLILVTGHSVGVVLLLISAVLGLISQHLIITGLNRWYVRSPQTAVLFWPSVVIVFGVVLIAVGSVTAGAAIYGLIASRFYLFVVVTMMLGAMLILSGAGVTKSGVRKWRERL